MSDGSEFIKSLQTSHENMVVNQAGRVAQFSDMVKEYHAIKDGFAIADRNHRSLLEVTGADRASWLHNLTTNHIRDLGVGDGQYAYALNLQGRILFDMNVLVHEEKFWLDIDRRFVETALPHFEKYTIVEDVKMTDVTNDYVRIGFTGPLTIEAMQTLGASHAQAMPALGVTKIKWQDQTLTMIRHDFCGPLGAEFFVPADQAIKFWQSWTKDGATHQAIPVGDEALEIHRIESGIPRSGFEITDDYLPAETKQLDRAVSYNKGCYLGQEVVERMRSRGVVARQLCGLVIEGETLPHTGAEILSSDDKPIGNITSACRSIAQDSVIGLGYVKTASASPNTPLHVSWESKNTAARVSELPFNATVVQK